MTERRFNEAEVAAILGRAAKADPTGTRQISQGEGMSLAELQDIGREAGISADAIRDAALVVGQSGLATSRRFLGLPLGVGRTIELDRKLTDDEWERFVVDLRETFDARGVVRREGSLRQWSNGNLHALLEPTADGHRVRLRTTRGEARAFMSAGIGMVGLSAAVWAGTIFAGVVAQTGKLSGAGVLAFMGVSLFGLGAVRLPGWANRRRRQMEELAERLTVKTSEPQAP